VLSKVNLQVDPNGKAVLSVREAQVLRLLCQDAPTDKEIATRLKIAERTVCDYMRAIREGLGLSTRGALILWCVNNPAAFEGAAVVLLVPPPDRCPTCGGPRCWTKKAA
jgi:DNA-binding CsgD family transcriptional regulator